MVAEHRRPPVADAHAPLGAGEKVDGQACRVARKTVHIAGQDQQVDLDTIEQTLRSLGNGGKDVDMRVADMEDAIAIEGGWQPRLGDLEGVEPEIEGIAYAPPMERRQPSGGPAHREQERQ